MSAIAEVPDHLLGALVQGRQMLLHRKPASSPGQGREFEEHWQSLLKAAQATMPELARYASPIPPRGWHHRALEWNLILDVPGIGRLASCYVWSGLAGWVNVSFARNGWWAVLTYQVIRERGRWLVVPAPSHEWLLANTDREALALAEQQTRLRHALEADAARQNGDLQDQ